MARRIPLALVLGIVLAACTARSPGTQIPPQGTFSTTVGLETAAIRETVMEFLRAYAQSGTTVRPLQPLVAGPELRDWVHWLGVQNRHLGLAGGDLEVRGIRVLQIRDDVAAAALDATVTFTFVAQEAPVPRSFQSPIILTRRPAPGSWAVADFVRDGRSMTDSITIFDPPVSARTDGLVVKAVSVYRFTSRTMVNLRMRNVRGDEQVRVDRERSVLHVSGQPMRPLATTSTLSRTIPLDDLVQGAFQFPGVELTAVPEGMHLRFHGNRDPVTLAFPAEAFAQGA
jgi:hypothetical protein